MNEITGSHMQNQITKPKVIIWKKKKKQQTKLEITVFFY